MITRSAIAALSLSTVLAATAVAEPGPGLWRLEDEDTTIYLFGTIHSLPEGVDWRREAVETAFQSAETFCVETDIEANIDEILRLTFKEGVFRGPERLTDYLDEEQEAELREFAAELNVVFPALDVMKPWNAMFTLASAFSMKAGWKDELGVDNVLYADAVAAGKTICEMESPFDHVMSIASLPMEVQVAVFVYEDLDEEDEDLSMAELIAKEIEEFDELVEDWLAVDLEAMSDEPEDMGHPAFYDAILTKRNRAWVDKIEIMLDSPGTVFIAVGAAHLAGPDSVQVMLRDRGYTVYGPDHVESPETAAEPALTD